MKHSILVLSLWFFTTYWTQNHNLSPVVNMNTLDTRPQISICSLIAFFSANDLRKFSPTLRSLGNTKQILRNKSDSYFTPAIVPRVLYLRNALKCFTALPHGFHIVEMTSFAVYKSLNARINCHCFSLFSRKKSNKTQNIINWIKVHGITDCECED